MKALSILAIIGILAANAQKQRAPEGNAYHITCEISRNTNRFDRNATATYSPTNGLSVFALQDNRTGPKGIFMKLPSLAKGTFTIANTPGLRMAHNENHASSDHRSEFIASAGTPGSTLSVTIEQVGEVGEPIQGTFYGTLKNSSDRLIHMTNGSFRVLRTAPEAH